MHRTVVCLVRGGGGRGLLSNVFGSKKTTAADETATQLTKEQQEKLRGLLPSLRTDEARRTEGVQATEYSDDMADTRVDMDAIRARGVLKYRFNYTPPANVSEIIMGTIREIRGSADDSLTFDDIEEKAQVLLELSRKLKHTPTNSRLLYLKTISDVVDFYKEPVSNVNKYTELVRSPGKPTNVTVLEQPVRFHPEDTHAWHGGVTAFPGTGGQVLGMRNKRLLRQFKPKEEWFDYEDQNFDYSPPDKDMPWDPEIARKMDRYPDRRLSLRTKTFVRT